MHSEFQLQQVSSHAGSKGERELTASNDCPPPSSLRTKVNRYPAYQQLLTMGKERRAALFLDIGCGVGNDVRRAVADGFPASQAIASDLHPGA